MADSDFMRRKSAALELLSHTGMWRSNYEPPYLRLLRRMNIEVRPPHFLPFWRAALIAGAYFTVWIGVLTALLLQVLGRQIPLASTIIAAICAGVFFGLFMATYYAYGRWRHGLPKWGQL